MTTQQPAPSEVEAVTPGVIDLTKRDFHRGHRRFLAPSLAGVMVLLAVIGLSGEMILYESPKPPFIPERQAVAGQTVRKPDTDSTSGRLSDTNLDQKKRKSVNEPELVGLAIQEETSKYRNDEAPQAATPPPTPPACCCWYR